jgi:hypothetical protein
LGSEIKYNLVKLGVNSQDLKGFIMTRLI